MPLAARWRWLDSGAADGATNMAVDHALMERAAETGEAVFRVYAWSRPTLSFGMHERTRLRPETVAAAGLDAVRRPTGGRALLHDREVTYAVAAPINDVGLADSYAAINEILAAALARLGVGVQPAPRRGRASAPDGQPCFAEPNVGELELHGRKLVGSAQRRDERALLQHGSILLADDQPRIAALRGLPPDGTAAASLNEALGRDVAYPEVAAALDAALRDAAGASAVEPLDAAALRAAVERLRPHYVDPQWTWRR